MGGEKARDAQPSGPRTGSPPHGRGKDVKDKPALILRGITPAWAGKRARRPSWSYGGGDHPRMGGEKVGMSSSAFFIMGSPPHGRGKGLDLLAVDGDGGITPAWAGKRLKRSHRSGIFISGPIPFHSVLHRPAGSGGSRAGRDGSPAGQPQNAGPA